MRRSYECLLASGDQRRKTERRQRQEHHCLQFVRPRERLCRNAEERRLGRQEGWWEVGGLLFESFEFESEFAVAVLFFSFSFAATAAAAAAAAAAAEPAAATKPATAAATAAAAAATTINLLLLFLLLLLLLLALPAQRERGLDGPERLHLRPAKGLGEMQRGVVY